MKRRLLLMLWPAAATVIRRNQLLRLWRLLPLPLRLSLVQPIRDGAATANSGLVVN